MTRALALLLLLAACAGPALVRDPCPVTLPPLPQDMRDRMADELDAPPPKPALTQAVADYLNLRAEIRACKGQP